MPQELILALGSAEQTKAIYEVCVSLGVEFCEITQTMLDTPLSLCIHEGQRGVPCSTSEFSADAAVIFSGFSRKRLDEALDRISDLKIPLKAVVTQKNQSWTVRQLLEELAKERAYFAAMNREKNTQVKPIHQQDKKEKKDV